MRRFLLFVLAVALIVSACEHSVKNIYLNPSKPDNYQVNIKIPTAWIEKLRGFDYSRNTKTILKEFEGFIKPDTLISNGAHTDTDYGRMVAPIFTDLDEDQGDELICLIGWGDYDPSLCVFKKKQNDWYLIYLEDVHTFYSAPAISIANNFSRNKTFYFRHVNDHGSGVYADSYAFYKVIGNRVYKCLDLVNEARIQGWGLFLNQDIKMEFDFNGDSDGLWVKFTYNFYHTIVKSGKQAWEGGDDVSLIQGEDGVGYKWNNKIKKYELDVNNAQVAADELTDQKITCFGNFGNDTLFVKAFRRQIDTLLKIGSAQQKKILTQYLNEVKKDKKVVTEELEVKSHAGGTNFYDPKIKK
jgi:hypothetical protein